MTDPSQQRKHSVPFGLGPAFALAFGTFAFGDASADPGDHIRVGEATVRVAGHVGRCATTTRDPESGKTDLKTLLVI